MPVNPTTARTLRREASALAGAYPALLAEAERVAAVVAQGVHGRRRAGRGETFWQYRAYTPDDPAHRIDWRRSARGRQLYVRDNEWEAANSVYFWRDGSGRMDWQSSEKLPLKRDRATVLAMATASLLMRGGERCAVIGESERPRAGRVGLERLQSRLASSPGEAPTLNGPIPAHARLIILSDFLEGADIWRERLARLSARPAKGVLVQIIDPAEQSFPYKGRIEMRLPGALQSLPLIVGRAERAQDMYRKKFEAHCAALADTARRLDWPLIVHHTDQPAGTALTALYGAISEADRL